MSIYFKRNNRVNETSGSGDKISQKTVENFVSSASALSEGIHCLLKIVESHFSRSFMRLIGLCKVVFTDCSISILFVLSTTKCIYLINVGIATYFKLLSYCSTLNRLHILLHCMANLKLCCARQKNGH